MEALSRSVTPADKQMLIMDALRAADCRCRIDAIFLQIFFDYLVIYFHGAIKATLSNGADAVCSLHSWEEQNNQYFSKEGLVETTLGALKLSVCKFKKSQADTLDRPFLKLLLEIYADRLTAGLASYKITFPRDEPAPKSDPVTGELLEPVRGQLDAIYQDITASKVLKHSGSQTKMVPLFAVARHPSVTPRHLANSKRALNYTPHLLLSEEQGRLLVDQSHQTDARALLERELTSGISQADSPLLSGTADLMEPGGPRKSNQPPEAKKLEVLLYAEMCGGLPYFFVPVHIGSTPWMSFFTVQSLTSQRDWLRLYHFYRDVFPYTAGAIAASVHTALLNALVKTALSHCKEGQWNRDALSLINREWAALLAHFPFFEAIRLDLSESMEPILQVTPLNGVRVRTEDSTSFASRIKSDLTKKMLCAGINKNTAVIRKRGLHLEHGGKSEVLEMGAIETNSIRIVKQFEITKKGLQDLLTEKQAMLPTDWTRYRGKRGNILCKLTGRAKDDIISEEDRMIAVLLLMAQGLVRANEPKLRGAVANNFLEGVRDILGWSDAGTSGHLQSLLDARSNNKERHHLYTKFVMTFESIDPADPGQCAELPLPYRPFVREYISELWEVVRQKK